MKRLSDWIAQNLSRLLALALVLAIGEYARRNWSGLSSLSLPQGKGSLWESLLLTPQVVLVFRLGVLAAVGYIVASVVGLVVEGRWIAKLGPGGAETDALSAANETDKKLEERLADVEGAGEVGSRLVENLIQTMQQMQARLDELERKVP